jgi:translation initiation factor IF-2
MSEVNTPRLMAAAKEFNIGTNTLIDFLVSKNFNADELKPTTKLTEAMYHVLQSEFQQDKAAKQKAEQVDLPKGANADQKKKKDEEDLSFKKKEEKAKAPETKPEPIQEEPAPAPVVEIPEEEPQQIGVTKIDAPEIGGLKILDKIDLDSIDSSTRPKKAKKKEQPTIETPEEIAPVEEKTPEVIEVVPETTDPVAPVIAKDQEPAAAIIENIQAQKLTGPKILGKIDLPVNNDTRPKKETNEEKQKRKRIPIQKKGPDGGGAQRGNKAIPDGRGPRPPHPGGQGGQGGQGQGNKFQRPGQGAPKREDKIIDEKEIQEKLKQTQAKLAGSGGRGKSLKAKYRKAKREEMAEQMGEGGEASNKLQVTEFISVSELAGLMDVSFADIISKCMNLGIMVSINQRLEADVIELVASEFNYEVEFIGVDDAAELEVDQEEDNPEDLKPRAPIVTIMGHVDHGKTSLLDYIRNTNVIAGEAGGITQHIGAYEVTLADGRAITFLDTPGHEAFTAMRARGAKVTDIAVIVVAADDAVMPQTKEAISHAQAANVPMIFAINKVDKDGANPEKIKEQLATMNILVESWGGKFQSQEISAKKGMNINLLLEKILLETDILELKANPIKEANGTIIEASLDKGRGYVATSIRKELQHLQIYTL